MDEKESQMLGFEIVAYSGDTRSILPQLLKEIRSSNFDNVDKTVKDADEDLTKAHNAQTQLLTQEAGGGDLELGFTFVRSQDHLMTTLLLRDLITDFIKLYKNR